MGEGSDKQKESQYDFFEDFFLKVQWNTRGAPWRFWDARRELNLEMTLSYYGEKSLSLAIYRGRTSELTARWISAKR
jgi:hypothetical protein